MIEIPKEEALTFIEKDCNGNIENIIDKLKYDHQNETLYLVSDSIDYPENEVNDFNPEIHEMVTKKKEETKKKNGKKSKESIDPPKKNTERSKKSE